jgi:hypothetical protein
VKPPEQAQDALEEDEAAAANPDISLREFSDPHFSHEIFLS